MTPGSVSKRIIIDRLTWIENMVAEINALPLNNHQAFFSDTRNLWTAESCLRRALEALFDLGRHILAKGFGIGVSEYKEIAHGLSDHGVLSYQDGELLSVMAGYRNRLVHFYHEIGPEELYEISKTGLGDLEHIAEAYRAWLGKHPEFLDETL